MSDYIYTGRGFWQSLCILGTSLAVAAAAPLVILGAVVASSVGGGFVYDSAAKLAGYQIGYYDSPGPTFFSDVTIGVTAGLSCIASQAPDTQQPPSPVAQPEQPIINNNTYVYNHTEYNNTVIYQQPMQNSTVYHRHVSNYQQNVSNYQPHLSNYQPYVSNYQPYISNYQQHVSNYQQPAMINYGQPMSGYYY